MKKITCFILLIICIIGLSSCGMKECECYSTNIVKKADTLVQNTTDTVTNFTHGDCTEFNLDSVYVLNDSLNIRVYHSILCLEK